MKKTSLLIALCLMASSSFALDNSPAMQQMQQDANSFIEKNMRAGETYPGQRTRKPGEVIPMVKDALPRLQNLQKLVWLAQHRIATIQDWSKKAPLQNRALIILESLQKDMDKAGFNSPELRQSPDALVYGWQQEGYINALNVTFQLDVDTCRLATNQIIEKFKLKTNNPEKMTWHNKETAQQITEQLKLITQLEQHCKIANNRVTLLENSSKTVENALKFNEIYKQLNAALQPR